MSEIPKTRYVSVAGSDVAYQVLGEGPIDLVYFSGIVSHVDVQWEDPVFARAMPRLASFSRVIVFDRRGVGASDPLPSGVQATWEEWIEDVGAVLDAVESDRAAIFAELDAGPIAMLFAATYPERTSALVLGNTSARFLADDDYPVGLSEESAEGLVELVESAWGSEDAVRALMPSMASDEHYVRSMAKQLRATLTPRAAAAQYRYLIWNVDVRPILPLVRVPTLVFQSTEPPVFPKEQGQYLADQIADAKLVMVVSSDLGMMGDQFDDVVEEVEEFLTGERRLADANRALATVLFTDIVSSTERIAEIGDRKWSDLLTQHNDVVGRCLAQFRGRHVDSAGDGVLATFDGPARAIRCACAIRDALGPLGIEVRAGLHTGEVELAGDDVRGIAVHIGARVSALAGAGEVLVSRTVTDLVAGSGLEFEDRGEHELKGVPGMWAIYAVKS